MSRKNDKFVIANKNINATKSAKRGHTKCGHHCGSYVYQNNVNIHKQIVSDLSRRQVNVDMTTPIHIIIALHFLAPTDTFTPTEVLQRANEIVQSINDDFNNYSPNPYIMNFLRYKNVVTEVFIGDLEKQDIYLSEDYQNTVPLEPSYITFELGNIYYYPVASRLNLTQYDDVDQIELEFQAVKQFIYQNNAVAISPENFLNIWIIDMVGTDILGYTNFPWEPIDIVNGILINRAAFFPEELTDNEIFFPYDQFKTFTHEIGHYLGLLHPFDNENDTPQAAVNMHEGGNQPIFPGSTQYTGDYIADTPFEFEPIYDPYIDQPLQTDINYNPLFMNFMDYTYDEFLTNFTYNQIQKMRYMIFAYRPEINSFDLDFVLPTPTFNPLTRTLTDTVVSAIPLDLTAKIAQAAKTVQASNQTGRNIKPQKGTAKYNKYGQPIETAKVTKLPPKQSTKRFVRTKPI